MNILVLQNNVTLFHKHFLFLRVKLFSRVICGVYYKLFKGHFSICSQTEAKLTL